MSTRKRLSRRVIVAVGIGLLHAGIAWVLVHERYRYDGASRLPTMDLFLIRPVPRVPHVRTEPRASRINPPIAIARPIPSPVASLPVPAETPETLSFAESGRRAAAANGQGLAEAESRRGFGFPPTTTSPKQPVSIEVFNLRAMCSLIDC